VIKVYTGFRGWADGQVEACELRDLKMDTPPVQATVLVCDEGLSQLHIREDASLLASQRDVFCFECALTESAEFPVTFHGNKAKGTDFTDGAEWKCQKVGINGFDCR
jgi:hypothetical protein